MRDIHFRAWDKEENEMLYSDPELSIGFNVFTGKWTGGKSDFELEHIILMQYTGLKDKNGKEIYEGDILKQADEDIIVAEYKCLEVDAFEGIGFNLWSFIGEYNKFDCARLQSELEVIGNIYENPELLK